MQDILVIMDIANNHSGYVEKGLEIINKFHDVIKEYGFNFAFKLQYRDLDTFIHNDYKNAMDYKYIKRFTETRLRKGDLKILKDRIVELGYYSVCTPFDENSVELAIEHGYDALKVASCSFTDWLLLEKIVGTDKPIILSTAGSTFDDIDKVVSFLDHRLKTYSLLHCVAEYPTPKDRVNLNRIRIMQDRYSDITIGYSSHESPDNIDSVKIAVGMGCKVFEKHIGIGELNKYSSNPVEFKHWLDSLNMALESCEIKENNQEQTEIRSLQRGAYAKHDISMTDKITNDDLYFAIPTFEEQYTANDMSKYVEYYALTGIKKNEQLNFNNAYRKDRRGSVYKNVRLVNDFIKQSGVCIPQRVDIELSHHYGLDDFSEYGMTIFTIINIEYCKKILVLLPNQRHPAQYHMIKHETFNVLYGELDLYLASEYKKCKTGDIISVERGIVHEMSTTTGCIIEELSSTHFKNDSYYIDDKIMQNKNRKTKLTYWLE